MAGKTNLAKVIKNLSTKEKAILLAIVAVLISAVVITMVFLTNNKEERNTDSDNVVEQEEKEDSEEEIQGGETHEDENQPDETQQEAESKDETEDIQITDEDPQEIITPNKPEGDGASVDVSDVVVKDENETEEITLGIDVSKYQGTISWKKVAESGIDFVMVRVGYRTMANGEIVADTNAKYNMQEAQKYGIKLGAYFFSTATSNAEAIEEANWVADYIAKYKITYPVAYNCEGFENSGSRQYNMTKTQRTDAALAFMNRITERGYSSMFYASKSEMEGDSDWETSRISSLYKVWVAQYPSAPYPQTASSSYTGTHAMWQYTNKGTVPGISVPVDVNIAYFGYDKVQDAHDSEAPEDVTADVEALMKFTAVEETVTAKNETNLRDKPSQGSDSTVLYTLKNGETATRTGTSNSGWSRVVFNGKTYYAVSSYLTTDLSYKPPQEEPDDGINTEFKAVNEKVTAKDVVNLRAKPSVDDTIAPVVVQLKNGEVATRTGINNEVGWSRVEYNGQTLYCVSSYLMLAE